MGQDDGTTRYNGPPRRLRAADGLRPPLMQQFDEYGSGSPTPPKGGGGFSAKSALLAFAFCTFVLGGFAFGWLFMTNWKLLGAFQVAMRPIIVR